MKGCLMTKIHHLLNHDDKRMAWEVVNKLRFKFGMTYKESQQRCEKGGMSAPRFEEICGLADEYDQFAHRR